MISSSVLDKNRSQELKGVAILFMIFGHLMNDSVSAFLGRCMGPVAFFLVLSGYGMFVVNQTYDRHRWSRILRIYSSYWIVLVTVIMIGQWSNPEFYSLSFTGLLGNVVALNPSFIPEVWFLLPYVLLTTTSKRLIDLLHNYRVRYVIGFCFLLSVCTSFCLSRYGTIFLYKHRIIYVFFCYFHLLFPFILGILLPKILSFLNSKMTGRAVLFPLFWLFSLMLFRCLLNISIFHPLYVILFIFLYLRIKKNRWMAAVLQRLGLCSMNIWFIHTSLFLYLWPKRPLCDLNPFFYFCVVVITCWLVAECIQVVSKWINAFVTNKIICVRSC